MKPINPDIVLKPVKEYILMAVGMLMYSFGWIGCILPAGGVGGGAAGLSLVDLLSLARERSPCKIWISTEGWLSAAVENTSDFLVGMVVLASISLVITPPSVSIPNDSGVTSSNKTSFTSPVSTPPWIAAPTATTSSGLTPFEGAFPKNSCTFC